ncbi:MAG: hypothetical protein WC955_00795 [Elusimicrobiota bacterium]
MINSKWLEKIQQYLNNQFTENDDPTVPQYDPVHLGAMIIIVMTVLTVLYWLLWTILVYTGGIFPKLQALTDITFTAKTFKDYPEIFEGLTVNTIALAILFFLVYVMFRIRYLLTIKKKE